MISVIVTAYNTGKTIKKCLDSILDGSENLIPFEIIVIDDGSTDDTATILNNYETIKVFHQSNTGVSSARNLGIKHAQGKYIMFVDSDDQLAHNWAYAVHQAITANPNSDFLSFSQNIDKHPTGTERLEHICGLNDNLYSSTVWSKLYRLSVIKKYNIRFNEKVINGEDMLFNLNFNLYCAQTTFYPESIYIYNINSSSATHVFNSNIVSSDLEFQKELMATLSSYDKKKYLYLSNLSIINAWLTIFNRYSYHTHFSKDDLDPLLNNPLYINQLQQYYLYQNYFSKPQKILLWLLLHHQYRVAYLILKIKNSLRSHHDRLERI